MKKVLVAGEQVLVDDFEIVLGSASAICAMGPARLRATPEIAGRTTPGRGRSMKLRTAVAFALLLAVRLVHAVGIESAAVDGDGIRLEFDSRMRSRVVATFAGETALGPFEESETLLTAAGALGDFALESREEGAVSDALGDGRRVTLTGHAGRIAKRVEVTAYAAPPALAVRERPLRQ